MNECWELNTSPLLDTELFLQDPDLQFNLFCASWILNALFFYGLPHLGVFGEARVSEDNTQIHGVLNIALVCFTQKYVTFSDVL